MPPRRIGITILNDDMLVDILQHIALRVSYGLR